MKAFSVMTMLFLAGSAIHFTSSRAIPRAANGSRAMSGLIRVPFDVLVSNVDTNGVEIANLPVDLASDAIVQVDSVIQIYSANMCCNNAETVRLYIDGALVFDGTNGSPNADGSGPTGFAQQLVLSAMRELPAGSHTIVARMHIRTGLGGSLRTSNARGDVYIKWSPLASSADLDGDGDVDLADFSVFQGSLTGPW